jgi:hypothetical protein
MAHGWGGPGPGGRPNGVHGVEGRGGGFGAHPAQRKYKIPIQTLILGQQTDNSDIFSINN